MFKPEMSSSSSSSLSSLSSSFSSTYYSSSSSSSPSPPPSPPSSARGIKRSGSTAELENLCYPSTSSAVFGSAPSGNVFSGPGDVFGSGPSGDVFSGPGNFGPSGDVSMEDATKEAELSIDLALMLVQDAEDAKEKASGPENAVPKDKSGAPIDPESLKDTVYEVEEILSRRVNKETFVFEYLVQFVGLDRAYWVPFTNLRNSRKMLQEFEIEKYRREQLEAAGRSGQSGQPGQSGQSGRRLSKAEAELEKIENPGHRV